MSDTPNIADMVIDDAESDSIDYDTSTLFFLYNSMKVLDGRIKGEDASPQATPQATPPTALDIMDMMYRPVCIMRQSLLEPYYLPQTLRIIFSGSVDGSNLLADIPFRNLLCNTLMYAELYCESRRINLMNEVSQAVYEKSTANSITMKRYYNKALRIISVDETLRDLLAFFIRAPSPYIKDPNSHYGITINDSPACKAATNILRIHGEDVEPVTGELVREFIKEIRDYELTVFDLEALAYCLGSHILREVTASMSIEWKQRMRENPQFRVCRKYPPVLTIT